MTRDRMRHSALAAIAFAWIFGGVAAAQGHSPTQLRRFVDEQVGGIAKLMVPAHDTDIPQPRLANGSPDPQFVITEAKRYLGKQLFHDPIRTARILPEFGGVLATRQTASCASCHVGEAASKAGTLLNFAVGGEGRGFTDAGGNFTPRRRPRSDLPRLRTTPLFAGDALVDELPTLTDIYQFAVGSPARGRKLPPPGALLRTGRLDALDSVARNAPSVIGAAFNNRLLMGGFAGEPDDAPGGLNPFGFPAPESVALLLLDAHRMLEFQSAELQKFATYRKLFRDAFPAEAAAADAKGDLNLLINDITVLRATATFLRTTVTRNTPWDRFLTGDNGALTVAQRRGARLFFTPAAQGGGGCYTCHSGPMFNKQVNDPDVAGIGGFVEENFYNVGLADHPLQALNRVARHDPNFRDDGRREITGRDTDAFKFPQDADAAAAGTLTPRFTQPRGAGSPSGLGLSGDQMDDLTDFIENGLYDPAFVRFDPESPTRMFELGATDVVYSVYRPDLAELGAIDGRPASGLPQDNDDALSRRDAGLEFLDVTGKLNVARIDSHTSEGGKRREDVLRIANVSPDIVDTHLLLVVQGLADRLEVENASGFSAAGDPYIREFLADGALVPGQAVTVRVVVHRPSHGPEITYAITLLSGQGNP
ncbi:MAG: hypothetical protein DMF93_01925 [Acidobacteria bacterium]|nr:MAG: hypothetical protein DMF93_01925 [Acidobacteriota bacterium]